MNQEPQILDYRNFDFNKLEYYDPLQTKGGSYLSNINYLFNENKSIPIYIQTPRLRVAGEIVKTSRKTYIELELDSSDSSNLEFYNFLTKFDETNLVTCHRRSKHWFGFQFPLDDIDKSYDGSIKSNRGKSPSIKLNLQTIRSNIVTEIYNDRKKPTNIDYIESGDYVVAIIEIDGLKFGKSRFLFDMSVSQIKVFKTDTKGKLIGYHIQDEQIIKFQPGKDDNDEILSDIEEDDNHRISPKIDDSLDTGYNNTVNDEVEQIELPDNEIEYDNEVNDIQEEHKINSDNDDDNNYDDDNVNNHDNDGQEDIKELKKMNDEINVNYSMDEVQKPINNDFVSNVKNTTRQYYEDIDDITDELNTVNFGIDDNQYQYQVAEVRDNLRKLMNDYELYKDDCQYKMNNYRTKISSTTEQYHELCHRYNVKPEF